MLIVLLIRTYLTSCCNDFLSRADRKFTGRNISFLLYGKRPEWNKTMSPAPEKQQNALICNSGPNLNEQRFKNLDISHSDLAFKSIQDFLRVKWVKQRLIWSMIYNRPSFSLFRWIKIWVVAFQLFTFPLFIDRTGKTQEKYWAKILRQENTVKNLALRRADSP